MWTFVPGMTSGREAISRVVPAIKELTLVAETRGTFLRTRACRSMVLSKRRGSGGARDQRHPSRRTTVTVSGHVRGPKEK